MYMYVHIMLKRPKLYYKNTNNLILEVVALYFIHCFIMKTVFLYKFESDYMECKFPLLRLKVQRFERKNTKFV